MNRYGDSGQGQLPEDSLELSMDTAAGLHSLESFTMAGIKEDQEEVTGTEAGVTEETVVYFTPGPEVSRVHVYTIINILYTKPVIAGRPQHGGGHHPGHRARDGRGGGGPGPVTRADRRQHDAALKRLNTIMIK